jgi:hypothetical protein
MGTITLRVPDDKHERLRNYAKSQKVSLNQLFNELSTKVLTEFDTKTRFKTLAKSGDKNRGLELLDKIDYGFK